jgi:hypothetical protein
MEVVVASQVTPLGSAVFIVGREIVAKPTFSSDNSLSICLVRSALGDALALTVMRHPGSQPNNRTTMNAMNVENDCKA